MLAGVSRSVAVAAWHALLESAASANDAGRFTTSARRVAVILHEPLDPISALFDAYSELGLIASSAIVAWTRRQYESDNSTPRVRKHRQSKRNGDETLHCVTVTPPETKTETDISEADASGAAAPPAPPDPPKPADLKAAVFASGVPLLTSTGTTDRNARSMLGRWRQKHGDGAVLDALSAAQTEAPSDPIAWITKALDARNGQRPSHNRSQRGTFRDPLLNLVADGRRPGLD